MVASPWVESRVFVEAAMPRGASFKNLTVFGIGTKPRLRSKKPPLLLQTIKNTKMAVLDRFTRFFLIQPSMFVFGS
jgi:hypothetical protein